MREIKSSIGVYIHNPEHAVASISEVDGNFYGWVKVYAETFSDLQMFFNDPSLAENLGAKLLEMARELREKQGEQNDSDNK